MASIVDLLDSNAIYMLIATGIVILGIIVWWVLSGRFAAFIRDLGETTRRNIVRLALWGTGISLAVFIILLGLGYAISSLSGDPDAFLIWDWIVGLIF